MPALRVVLFVSHRMRSITLVERTTTGWSEREIRAGEVVPLPLAESAFAVDEVYEGIALDQL